MRRVGIILVLLLLVGGALAIGFWWGHRKHERAVDPLLLYGNVDIRQVQLAFNGNERIAALLVDEGDRVKAGQLLARMDSQRLAARVASGEAQVQAQQEVLARLEAGNRPEEVRRARADLQGARAALRNAELTYRRALTLASEGVDTRQRRDDARAAQDTARAQAAAALKTYQLMVLGPRKEDIAAARATLNIYKGNLALARRELADAQLYAPTSGVIQDRLLEAGDMASPQKPVFTLALDNPVWVRAYVPETSLGKIRTGMKAEVTTDSFPGKRYPGWIGFISPTAEFTPKTVETTEVRTKLVYQVRVFVHNPQAELRLGMPVTVNVPLGQPERSAARTPAGAGSGSSP